MGRYIDEILQPGEKVLYSTNAHWIFFLPAIGAWVLAVALFVLSGMIPAGPAVLICWSLAAIVAIFAAVQDGDRLVPSLDHRDRRDEFAGRAQGRLYQAP